LTDVKTTRLRQRSDWCLHQSPITLLEQPDNDRLTRWLL
jgi:hypothetical protein